MNPPVNVQIEASWKEVLAEEFQKAYFSEIRNFLVKEKEAGKTIYPPGSLIFNAFNRTPFDQVKIVILGQDPYHGSKQAMGLSFSVPNGVRKPPSLNNIFKELKLDIAGFEIPDHGNLEPWADQGVFLLNAMLTVEAGKAGSHQKIGWQVFTDAVIQTISAKQSGIVFMLWGNFAKNKRNLIDSNKHLILESAHPSPFTGNAFFNNHHFSKANAYLKEQGKGVVDWRL